MNNNQQYSTIVRLNATEAKNQLDALTKKVQDLERARDKALSEGKDTKFVKDLNKQLKQASAELRSYETNVKATIDTLNNLSDATVGEIEKAIRAIKKEMKAVNDPAEYAKLNKHLESLKGRLADIKGEIRETKPLSDKIVEGFNKWQGAILAAGAAITGLSITIRKATQEYANMEESMASVRKYTGMSDEAVRDLNEDLKKINTRTSREQLNELAGAAGRLGIQDKESILEFVDAADKINIALGDDLGDGAVDKVGKLAMAFGEDDKKGLRGAMLATGSAINELSANSSANAGYLVEFTARIAGVGTTLKLTQANIMGLGAVLDENMQQSEMASTALSQTLMKMTADSSKFAKIAGRDIKEFGDLVKRDANAALLQFLEGLKGLGDETKVINALDDLSLDGTRAAGVLMALANKTKDITRLQKLANEAYEDAESVLNEFNIQNNTVQAQLDKNKKKFQETAIALGEKLLPVVSMTISTTGTMVKALNEIIEFCDKWGLSIIVLIGYIGALVIAEKADIIQKQLQVLWNEKIIASSKKLWAVLVAHPYVAIAAAIAAVVAITLDLLRANDKLSASQKALNKLRDEAAQKVWEEKVKIEQLVKVAKDDNAQMQERINATNMLNKIIPNYNAQLDKTTGKYLDNANALKAYLDQLQRKYEIEGAKEYLKDLGRQKAELIAEKTKAEGTVKELGPKVKGMENARMNSGQNAFVPMGAQLATYKLQGGEDFDKLRNAEQTIQRSNDGLKELDKTINAITGRYGTKLFNEDGKITITPTVITDRGGYGGSSSNNSSQGGNNTNRGSGSDDEEKKRKERIKRELEDLNSKYREEEALLQLDYERRILKEQEYLDKVSDMRVQHQAEIVAILKKNNADEEEIAKAESDLRVEIINQQKDYYKRFYAEQDKLENEQAKEKAERDKNKSELFKKFLADDVEATKKAYREMAEELYNYDEISEAELLALYDEIEKIGEETKEVSTNGLDAFSAGIINTALAVQDLTKKLEEGTAGWEDYAAVGMAAVNTIMGALSSLGDYYKAEADLEVKREEEKYDKMIDAAGKNRKQTEKLEKQKQKAVAKIKNEANEKEMKIQIAQAIAGGAQAAINAYASGSKVNVWLGPIAAAAAVAATAIQIATIKKQAEAQRETGYYSGGFTGGSNYRREAGVVHEGEFVANHQAVNNRQIYPALSLIDQAQRNHTIGSLTAADVSAAMGQRAVVSDNGQSAEVAAALVAINIAVSRLNAELEKGIDAKVYTEGEYGIARGMEWHNKIYEGL